MPSRKTPSKRRKRKGSPTLKDFFHVERSIKKERTSDFKVKLLEVGHLIFSRSENDISIDHLSDASNDVSTTPSKREQRKMRWTTLKEFYPVRRSSRKPESKLKKEKQQEIADTVLSEEERGLQVCYSTGKGRGIIAAKTFFRGDFVVEYRGDLIKLADAKRREAMYEQDPDVGCYMYFFQHKNQSYCVDATAETGYLGRLVNHSAKEPNCITRVVEVDNIPHLILVAARDIAVGEELLYDYGDRSREAVQANPWLRTT